MIVAVSLGLYFMSGDGLPKNAAPDTKKITEQTPMTDNASSTTPTETADTKATPETSPVASAPTPAPKSETNTAPASSNEVVLKTSMGDITLRLYANDVPKTSANFAKLVKEGFYDGVRFHRVIKGFMIQTGDPQSKDDALAARWGMGGPGYKFDDEINASSAIYQKGYKHGILAMANSGPNTNGSQFFIMAADYPLPPLYTIFGEVTMGLDVVDKIDAVQTGGNDRPVTPVTIVSAMMK